MAEESVTAADRPSDRLKSTLTIVGSIAGIVALMWNVSWAVLNEQRSYLQLSIEVTPRESSRPLVQTTIENKGQFSKRIDYAALVISPAKDDLHVVVDELRNCGNQPSIVNLNSEPLSDLLSYLPRPDSPLYCEGERSIVPIPFFYKEQVRIGNERLSSRDLIDTRYFRRKGDPSGPYEVRFVVMGEDRVRATLDLFSSDDTISPK